MKETGKKVGYLKGLLESLPADGSVITEKILPCIADLAADLSDRIDALDEVLADLNDYVESIDDDLSALEDDDELPFIEDDDDDDDEDDDDDDEDEPFHLVKSANKSKEHILGFCPECGKPFFYDCDPRDDTRFVCPHCDGKVCPVEISPYNVPTAKPVED